MEANARVIEFPGSNFQPGHSVKKGWVIKEINFREVNTLSLGHGPK